MKTTPLHALHKTMDAKMGEFAGYDMPLYYAAGVMAEHEWTRAHAGLFDVSHMGQVIISGADIDEFMERITPSSVSAMPAGRAKYTVLTNDHGGIVDDLIITRLDAQRFFAVLNAGSKEKDIDWIEEHLKDGLDIKRLDNRALIALQGPKAAQALKAALKIDTDDLPYMWMRADRLPDGTEIYISRLGYTGEDGFEISLPAAKAGTVWDVLGALPDVKPVGLAARDSLRLDMGYPLYGHDINEHTTPVEAGLQWIIGRENVGFIGSGIVREQLEDGCSRKRVGIILQDKGIAREGAEIRNSDGAEIGMLTSGGFSPTLKQAIGQGYVRYEYAEPGTPVFIHVRGRDIAAKVATMPFVPPKTRSMKKQAA